MQALDAKAPRPRFRPIACIIQSMSPPTAPVPHRSSSALQPLHWAARHAWRDLRSGELRWLLVAVLLAVAALAAVGFFAERLKGGLSRDSAQLLGGDVLVAADQPLPAEWRQWAQAQGLDTTATVSFPSMARADEAQGGG